MTRTEKWKAKRDYLLEVKEAYKQDSPRFYQTTMMKVNAINRVVEANKKERKNG